MSVPCKNFGAGVKTGKSLVHPDKIVIAPMTILNFMEIVLLHIINKFPDF
jgi:hypothetical protein